MRSWHDTARHKARIEIIPMIDVMMFMLVFFVLISVNVIPATGIKTNLPTSSATNKNNEAKVAVITLGKGGELQLNGDNLAHQELLPRLADLKRKFLKLSLVVKGDAETPLQRLIDVMDTLKAGGYDAMSIAAKPK